MRRAYTIYRLFGIDINVHVSFVLLPLLFGWAYGARGLFVVAFVFACVTLHELCHSLQARRFGLGVQAITLYPIGGVASLRSFGTRPGQEMITAAVGPLFNFVSAGLLYLPMVHWLGASTLWRQDVMLQLSLDTWPKTFASCFWINPLLGLFNLLPAFPMDGGRMLRSLLARRFSYRRATEIAVTLGRGFAIAFGLVGLLSRPINVMLILIALFVYHAASQERTRVFLRSSLEGFRVGQVMPRQVQTVSPHATLAHVMEQMFQTRQEDFPVLDGDQLVGFVPRSVLVQALHVQPHEAADRPVAEVMLRQILTVPALAPLTLAQSLMESSGWRALPVVDNQERFVGMITVEDLARVYHVMSEA